MVVVYTVLNEIHADVNNFWISQRNLKKHTLNERKGSKNIYFPFAARSDVYCAHHVNALKKKCLDEKNWTRNTFYKRCCKVVNVFTCYGPPFESATRKYFTEWGRSEGAEGWRAFQQLLKRVLVICEMYFIIYIYVAGIEKVL